MCVSSEGLFELFMLHALPELWLSLRISFPRRTVAIAYMSHTRHQSLRTRVTAAVNLNDFDGDDWMSTSLQAGLALEFHETL